MNDDRPLFQANFSPEHFAVLRQTRMDERSPGPLLTNIETLIDFIGTGIKTTSAYFALPQGVLVELNEAMVEPLPHDLKRPQFAIVPDIDGAVHVAAKLQTGGWRGEAPTSDRDRSGRARAVAIIQSVRSLFQSHGIVSVRRILGLRRNAKSRGDRHLERNQRHLPEFSGTSQRNERRSRRRLLPSSPLL